ncbi:hypothetical protein TNCV_1888621 [Trichonephila clavipes]|nr:hypothetical protein TNCV_1888621 [Trichonephila clavipes]
MIKPPCPCTVPTWHAGSIASCASDAIFLALLVLSCQNRDSSLHATRLQSSTLQSLSYLAQARCSARWLILSNDILVGRRLLKPIR